MSRLRPALPWFRLAPYLPTGQVTGPGSSTDNAIARWDGTTGGVIQNSGITIDDTNVMTGSWVARWSGGTAITAAQYEITRDADGTNQLHLNVPTGASFEFSINDSAEVVLDATNFKPGANDGNALGVSGTAWADLFLASGAVIDFAAANVVLTHSAGALTVSTGNLLVTTAGTASGSVVTIDGTQTLSNKTLTAPKFASGGFIADNNGNEQIVFTTTASATTNVEIVNAATGTAGPIIRPIGETNVDLKLAAIGTGAVHITTGHYGDSTADTDGATITFNCATSNLHTVTLGGNRTLALSNDKAGQMLVLELKQDGTGSRTVTWFSGISWAGGSAPTLTTTASKTDSIGIRVVTAGSAYYGFVIGANI